MTPRTLAAGDELPPLPVGPISRKLLVMFAGASGDHQAVHIDIDAARAKGRGDVFAHGMLMMAFLARLLTEWVPQERIRSCRARFVAITPVHAEPTCSARVVAVEDGVAWLDLLIRLADGTVVVRGDATVDAG